jgi:tetratricopeptide (TPR) repeat protein
MRVRVLGVFSVGYWLAALAVVLPCLIMPACAENGPAGTPPPVPVAINEDSARLMELGKLLMGQNNPAYALFAEKLPLERRNAAGEQALRTFLTLVKREPRYAEGWLWLGIAYTERLQYSKDCPQGKCLRSEATISNGLEAFKTAYTCKPTSEDCVKYYGDALIEFRHDFDGALKLWQGYLAVAKTDLQKVLAYVQAARACLNKAYFGKEAKLPPEFVRQQYQEAVNYVQMAAKLLPYARDVKEMQALLLQYKRLLAGK